MARLDLYSVGCVTSTTSSFRVRWPVEIVSFDVDDSAGGTLANPWGSTTADTGTALDGLDPVSGLPLDPTQEAMETGSGGGMLPAVIVPLATRRALVLRDPSTGSGIIVYEVVEVQVSTDWDGNVTEVAQVPRGWIGTATLAPGQDYEVLAEMPVGTGGGSGSLWAPSYDSLVGAVCFTAGTRIATPAGWRPVEAIRPGDLVETRDHGPQPVRWVGARSLSPFETLALPRLRPIRLAAGALGPGRPLRPLRLSPQHRVLVDLGPGTGEVLVAAKHLAPRSGIARDDRLAPVTYHHLLFDRHEVLTAEGLGCESLLPGPVALALLGPQAEAEVRGLVGDLAAYAPARPILRGGAFRRLAARLPAVLAPA